MLASGDAEYAISSVEQLRDSIPQVQVNLTLLDIEENAIKMSRENAEERGVKASYIHGDMRNLLEYYRQGRFGKQDIVTMKGICEYMDNDNLTAFIRHMVNPILKKGGVLISTNMEDHGKFEKFSDYFVPSKWQDYLVRFNMDVTKWLLHYKSRRVLEEINEDSGLNIIETTCDKSKLHGIVVAKKND